MVKPPSFRSRLAPGFAKCLYIWNSPGGEKLHSEAWLISTIMLEINHLQCKLEMAGEAGIIARRLVAEVLRAAKIASRRMTVCD
jgi:hypothetical protein